MEKTTVSPTMIGPLIDSNVPSPEGLGVIAMGVLLYRGIPLLGGDIAVTCAFAAFGFYLQSAGDQYCFQLQLALALEIETEAHLKTRK